MVPRKRKNKQLSTWVVTQRTKKDKLDDDKIKRLDEFGFSWDPQEEFWEQRFQELAAYKEKHGDCLVRGNWKNKQLATWVVTQRTKGDKLDDDKIKRLDELGFSWDPIGEFWEQRFQELVGNRLAENLTLSETI